MIVMISYNRGEWLQVEPVVEQLRMASLPVWLDREQLSPGAHWRGELLKVSRSADAFVPFLSRRYVESAMCRMELLMARSFRRPIFPVMLEECWTELAGREETKFIPDVFTARLGATRIVGLQVEPAEILERLARAIRHCLDAAALPNANVYVSYANGSARYATAIHKKLASVPGISPWIATQNCEVGQDWREAQTKSLSSCKVHVVVVSGDLLRDNQVLRTELLISEALGTETLCIKDPELEADTILESEVYAKLERDPGFRRLTEQQWLSSKDVDMILCGRVLSLVHQSRED